ncbi:MAG TPA: signal peptidase I [Clostridiales bacterium]|nr:signal peptidase I [Clostridiales bacterium]
MIKTQAKGIAAEMLDWGFHIVAALLAGFFIITFIGQLSIVKKTSMFPTLKEGDVVIVDKLTPRLTGYHRGDIVTIADAHPALQGEVLIKRLIAMGGDTLEFYEGKVILNGLELKESYLAGVSTAPPGTPPLSPENKGYYRVRVPEGMVYVMGDNRQTGGSFDSRDFGPVPARNITSRAFIRIYPLSRIQVFHVPEDVFQTGEKAMENTSGPAVN